MVGSEATLGKTLGHSEWQPLSHSVIQQLSTTTIYEHYTSIIPAIYYDYIVMISMKRSQRQWDQLVRAEKVPLLRGCQLYPKPGQPYRFQVYLPPLLCKPCMFHSHRLRAHTLIYLHSISNKVKPPRPSTQLQSHPWATLAQRFLDNCRPMAGSEATLGKTLGHSDRRPLCPSVIQQLSTQRTALFCYDTLATLLL